MNTFHIASVFFMLC